MTSDAAALRSAAAITWLPLIVVGVLVAGTGGLVLAAPDATVTLLTVVLALWLLITGIARLGLGLAMSVWTARRRALTVLTGAALAVAGIAALANVSGSTSVLGWAIGIGLLIGAAGDAAVLVSGRTQRSRGALVVLALAQLVLGVVFLLEPAAGLAGIAVVLGAALLAIGVIAVVGGFVVRSRVNRFVNQMTTPGGRPGGDDGGPDVIEGRVL
ncbi:DUF308 domain-containing protein [Actinotalea sp. M2MS4P-6]|uniref:DUF308 domain-containing protein n=1 Tax=Actinotalea sp. M2MS4P-6 TaxID=2983762 RepID=UPI0021E4C897|nr:DUF308 domain-containing protein [Actinotalea sp. M2MS4P-6]MCV2395664.1 DUF308 domain-containing protein [Actinotalea sp. M2MS4P-6]